MGASQPEKRKQTPSQAARAQLLVSSRKIQAPVGITTTLGGIGHGVTSTGQTPSPWEPLLGPAPTPKPAIRMTLVLYYQKHPSVFITEKVQQLQGSNLECHTTELNQSACAWHPLESHKDQVWRFSSIQLSVRLGAAIPQSQQLWSPGDKLNSVHQACGRSVTMSLQRDTPAPTDFSSFVMFSNRRVPLCSCSKGRLSSIS